MAIATGMEETRVGQGRSRVTRYLERGEGRIGYDVAGDGPLMVCVPGMGDVRSVYRALAADLVGEGYRVATMDLRGHGDSDTTFRAYDDVAAGSDVLALIEELGGPAIVMGNSMGAGAAVWAAAERPGAVAGLVLAGPFVRDAPVGRLKELAFRLAMRRPWGPRMWNAWLANLYPGRRTDEFEAHRAEVRASLRRPGSWDAFVRTTRTSHAPVEARLSEVSAPTLVVMGERDPDFPDPRAEAELVAGRLSGRVLMGPEAGHYPQAEFPEIVTPAVSAFAREVTTRA